ncbi:hypothetical protein EDD85DRAFT_976639 [Armillaria nabsnona]|nr:hypothetical protein EDD85DRAFT_976639 [Armillaria nabsnona]
MAPPSKKTKISSLSTVGIGISRFNELMQSSDAPLDEELKVLRQVTADAQCITFGLLFPFLVLFSAADAALFLEMVCGTVALVRCLRFVVSTGPGSAAPVAALFLGWRCTANGVLDLVFAFCWFRSIGPAVPAAPLFFEIWWHRIPAFLFGTLSGYLNSKLSHAPRPHRNQKTDLQCLYGDPRNSSDFECLNTHELPWVLTHVCGDWRTIAENAHELWSYITLDFDKGRSLTDDQCVQHNLFLLNLRIVRAQHLNQTTGNVHNLFVTIKSSHDVSSNTLFQMILQTAAYWKSLVVSLPMSSFSAWSALRPSFPRLERLKADLDGRDWVIRLWPQSTDVFEVAPKLIEVTNCGFKLKFHSDTAIPSWYSTLSAYKCSFGYKAVDEVHHLPNLQTLSLACYSHIDVAPVTLPCVSYLQLTTGPKGEVADFITTYKQLRLPSLRRVEPMFPLFEVVFLQGSSGLPNIPISSISIPPISNTITHLEIAEYKERNTEGNQLLLDFLRCFPNLSSFSLRDHSPVAFIRLFKGLTVTP